MHRLPLAVVGAGIGPQAFSHFRFDLDAWEKYSISELEDALQKAERIAEIVEFEKV